MAMLSASVFTWFETPDTSKTHAERSPGTVPLRGARPKTMLSGFFATEHGLWPPDFCRLGEPAEGPRNCKGKPATSK